MHTQFLKNLSTCTGASLKAGGSWHWPWRCPGFVCNLGKPFLRLQIKVERLNRSFPLSLRFLLPGEKEISAEQLLDVAFRACCRRGQLVFLELAGFKESDLGKH